MSDHRKDSVLNLGFWSYSWSIVVSIQVFSDVLIHLQVKSVIPFSEPFIVDPENPPPEKDYNIYFKTLKDGITGKELLEQSPAPVWNMSYREDVEFIFGTPNLVGASKWKILSVTLSVTALLLSMHSQQLLYIRIIIT